MAPGAMDPNKHETIKSFVQSMEEVSGSIRERNPGVIVAPMSGAIPFVDVLNIIDDDFDNSKVVYVPASNKVYRVGRVLRGAFKRIIEDKREDSYLSLDEVVSGNSLIRVRKQFYNARMDYANEATARLYPDPDFRDERVRSFRNELVGAISYNAIGIEDSKMERRNKKKNPEYMQAVQDGTVIPVKTNCIVTMDRADFFPAMYKMAKDSEGRPVFLPVIDNFSVSQAYIDFLGHVAGIVGKDPDNVTVSNMGKIRNSYNWVPEELRSL